MRTITKSIVASSGAVLALIAGGGIASAAPGDEAIVNSTCTYPQVAAALNAQSPDAAGQILGNPIANNLVVQLIGAPPAERQKMINQYRQFPQVQENIGLISAVAKTCNNYPG